MIEHFLNRRLPFDWRNPVGFVLATFIQLVVMFLAGQYLNAILSLAFGFVMFQIAVAKNMMVELRSINKRIKEKKSESDILKRLGRVINLHTDAKQLSELHSPIQI